MSAIQFDQSEKYIKDGVPFLVATGLSRMEVNIYIYIYIYKRLKLKLNTFGFCNSRTE
jgi:hypothetical protein